MSTIFDLKEQTLTETPLLLFDCVLRGGYVERWSTHRVVEGGSVYEPRVLQHNTFEMQMASEQGVDSIPQISLVLANADSHFSEIGRNGGWKGAQLAVSFLFFDLKNDVPASERILLFRGICNSPDEIRESTCRITATNRMNLQRLLLPQVRIQRRCPWEFPATSHQRSEAKDGGELGKYSRLYRCGYSPDVPGGVGRLDGALPFENCGYTRAECKNRGMFAHFGGIEFVPPQISVRTSGDKNWHASAVSVNSARYNDFVPMVYGTAWYTPPLVFARNDGNLTRMEVLLGVGEMQGVLKVLVNDVEIPHGVSGTDMTATGWYNIPTLGTRAGACNPDFSSSDGEPAGDPYGSMAYLSLVVPNRLNDGTTLARIRVLAQGLKVPIYDANGATAGEAFTSNPAWILLDALRRTGWTPSEIDLPSFSKAAAYCDEPIDALDIYGNSVQLPRFECNLALRARKSAGDLIRGIRNAARLILTYGADGLLQLRVENSLAEEAPVKAAWSNSTEALNGGWPSYEFGDGTSGYGGILRRADGSPSVRLYSRRMADTPNRFAVEFQDSLNEYQQDSYSVLDADDVAASGQEISTTLNALGIPNYDQAARISKYHLDKSVRGNVYVEFETSVKCLGVRPGDLITITYLKEGLIRSPFRVLKIAPGANYRVSTIIAQIHDDAWYADNNGQLRSATGGRRQGEAGLGAPRPLLGDSIDEDGSNQFGVVQTASISSEEAETGVLVTCSRPTAGGPVGPGIPLVSLAPIVAGGGTLAGGRSLYYALSACDSAGNESALSFLVRAPIMAEGSSVTLTGLGFAPETASFNVYRGINPMLLFRIATEQVPTTQFVDMGLPTHLVAPPDPNFDHANFYWRMERQPGYAATLHSPNTAGNSTLRMIENQHAGMVVRITGGCGAGQERRITSNNETTLTVAPKWAIEPDASSGFVIAENGWRMGAQTTTGAAQFTIPNRAGEVVHISGRSANVNNIESDPALAIVTRWKIGGTAADQAKPPKPFFGIAPGKRGGTVELSGISFTELNNTRSISSATLSLYFRDELLTPSSFLMNAITAESEEVWIDEASSGKEGRLVQLDGEIVQLEEELENGLGYRVKRACHGTEAAPHSFQKPVYFLSRKTEVAPFPTDFFGSPYSGSWSYAISLPNARIASAELFVTNRIGNSETSVICLTNTVERGLRTLSGGQYTIQVDGFLAIEQSAAPALLIEASRSIRDVIALLGSPADTSVSVQLRVDGSRYCDLTFAPGASVSNTVDGSSLPPLRAGAHLTLSILSVGHTSPGAGLTVVVRL